MRVASPAWTTIYYPAEIVSKETCAARLFYPYLYYSNQFWR